MEGCSPRTLLFASASHNTIWFWILWDAEAKSKVRGEHTGQMMYWVLVTIWYRNSRIPLGYGQNPIHHLPCHFLFSTICTMSHNNMVLRANSRWATPNGVGLCFIVSHSANGGEQKMVNQGWVPWLTPPSIPHYKSYYVLPGKGRASLFLVLPILGISYKIWCHENIKDFISFYLIYTKDKQEGTHRWA